MDQPKAAQHGQSDRKHGTSVFTNNQRTFPTFIPSSKNLSLKSNSNLRIKPRIIRWLNLQHVFFPFSQDFQTFSLFRRVGFPASLVEKLCKVLSLEFKRQCCIPSPSKTHGYDRFPIFCSQNPNGLITADNENRGYNFSKI